MVLEKATTPALAANHSSHPCPLPQGLRHYIVRAGNLMIPLVPADQLPFQLQGIPRQLSHQQMFEGGWKPAGETDEPALPIPVQAPAQTLPTLPKFLPPDWKVRHELHVAPETIGERSQQANRSSLYHNPKDYEELPPIRRAPMTMAERCMSREPSDGRRPAPVLTADHPLSLSDSFANIYQKDSQRSNYRPLPPSGVEPDPSKKEFCSYWIKTGECAFMATGCLYKHEMPPLEKLRDLGFREVPRWWKERTAVRPITWLQRHANQGNNGEDTDPANEHPKRRVFEPLSRRKLDRHQPSLGMLKSSEPKHERGILNKENERDLVESLTSYKKSPIPNLIDIDDTPTPTSPAPPPSLAWSNSSTTSDSDAESVASSPSSVSTPPSPCLDMAELGEVKVITKTQPRDVRRYSDASDGASWVSEDVKIHKRYPERKVTPKKPVNPTSRPTVSKRAGLARSKHAGKADPFRKTLSDKKNGTSTLSLQSQITNLVRQAGDKECRRRKAATQAKSVPTSVPIKKVAAVAK